MGPGQNVFGPRSSRSHTPPPVLSTPVTPYCCPQVLLNQPVVALVHASEDWQSIRASNDIYNGNCSNETAAANHAVLVVG